MTWIVLPESVSTGASGITSETLEATLATRVRGQLADGKYKEGDIRYVKDVSFLPIRDRLEVNAELLEKMRRLCQLWDVDLAPPRQITSHRKVIGPLIVAAKRCLFPILRIILKDTLRRQRDFNSQVIITLAEILNSRSSSRD